MLVIVDMDQPKLVIVTTVPTTLASILAQQPKFLAQHFDVALISSPAAELKKVAESEGVSTYAVPMERGISPVRDLISLYRMIKQIKKLKPAIVHSYTPKAGLITMLAGFICRVPVRVHTFTGLIFPTSTGVKKKILIWMDRLICACATTIVPEGNGVKSDLITHAVTLKPLAVIGNGNIAGVDTASFCKQKIISQGLHLPVKAQLNLPEDAFVFCFVGRFTKDKGFEELFEAFNSLPDNAHLLLVGELDERLPLPREIEQALNNHPRIHNVGWQNDIRPALAISHVLVLPSYREGFPNTPLQAGSMALPCIVTDINGCNEIITSGFNGWVVPVKNSNALTAAMRNSMQVDNLAQLGAQARSNIVGKFERQAHWQNLLCFYNEQLVKSN